MSLVVDAWSNRQRQGILALRVAYFGSFLSWEVRTISVKRIEGRHTKENIADMIWEEMVKWKITDKVRHSLSSYAIMF